MGDVEEEHIALLCKFEFRTLRQTSYVRSLSMRLTFKGSQPSGNQPSEVYRPQPGRWMPQLFRTRLCLDASMGTFLHLSRHPSFQKATQNPGETACFLKTMGGSSPRMLDSAEHALECKNSPRPDARLLHQGLPSAERPTCVKDRVD